MNLGLVLVLAGIAIFLGGLIYFFVLPDEKETGKEQPEMPVPPSRKGPNPPDRPEGPEEEFPESPIDRISEEELPEMPAPERPELVEHLDLSNRTITALKDSNIRVVAELENLDGEFEDIDGIGPTYAEEIREALREE